MPDFEKPSDWSESPHVVMLVDESGSMLVSRDTTVSAINDYLQGLKTDLPLDTTRVTLVKFDTSYANLNSRGAVRLEKVFDKTPLGETRELTLNDYQPRGGTPLNDAIGRTITQLDEALKKSPGPVYFAILTDGAENQSTEFTHEAVRKLIEERTKAGWTFAFLGVDIDAYAAAQSFSIHTSGAINLGRDTLVSSSATLSGSVMRKYNMAKSVGAEAYAAWNTTDATFTAEEKAASEKK